LAPSFDTVGWFAPNSTMLREVGRCLLPDCPVPELRRLLIVKDAFALLAEEVAASLSDALAQLRDRLPAKEVSLAPEGLASWAMTFRVHQGYEIWQAHGGWVLTNQPLFGPGVKERFAWASTITRPDFDNATRAREDIRRRVRDACGRDGALLLPTAPGIAPLLATPADHLEEFRNRALQLLCIAGLAGLPQISQPAGKAWGCPVGLSLAAPAGSDLALLDFANG
jgi:amidase